MKRAFKGGGIALSALALMIMTGVSASAADPANDIEADAVAAIESTAGAVLDTAVPVTSADAVAIADDGASFEISADPADGVSLTSSDDVVLEIGLPFADEADNAVVIDGTVVYDNNNGSTTTPLVHDDGSVQILTTIADASAPIEYLYEFPAGTEFVGFEDGSLAVLQVVEGTLEVTGSIAAAWAFDADGNAVPTHFEVRGQNLVQVVEHVSETTAYPVVADPTYWWGWQFGMSNSTTNKVVKAVGGAAAAAGVAAALQAAGIITIGTAAATAVVAALIAFGGVALDICNWNDRGVTIRGTWTGQFWCWAK